MTTHKGGVVYKYVEASTPETDDEQCLPPNSRIAVSVHAELLQSELYGVFCCFGEIEYIKILLGKPVAFVKFTKASSAETAIESARRLQVAGHIPRVYVAESKADQGKNAMFAQSQNPDDLPPRSRLFVKLANPTLTPEAVEGLFAGHPGFVGSLLIPAKAIAFVKFTQASEAALAMEAMAEAKRPEIQYITLAYPSPARPGAPPPRPSAYAASYEYEEGGPAYGPGPHYGGHGPFVRPGSSTAPPNERLFVITGKLLGAPEVQELLGGFQGLVSLDVKLNEDETPKGYAYATFGSVPLAAAALAALDQSEYHGALIKAVFADLPKPKQPKLGPGMAPPPEGFHPHPGFAPPGFLPPPGHRRFGRPGIGRGFVPAVYATAPRPGTFPHAAGGFPPAAEGPQFNADVPRMPAPGTDPEFPPGSRLFFMLGSECPITEDEVVGMFRGYPGLEYYQPKAGVRPSGFVKYGDPDTAAAVAQELNGLPIGPGYLKVVPAFPGSGRKRPYPM